VSHSLELLRTPHAVVRKIIHNGLSGLNGASLMPDLRVEDLAVVIRDTASRDILGGLWAHTGWEWLTIEMVFVPETLGGPEMVGRMIAMAEDEAVERGCHSAWLDTFDAGGLALYQSLGYERFGELKDFPTGRSRTFLQKKLKAGAEHARQDMTSEMNS